MVRLRGSTAGLCTPLPNLRRRPCRRPRTARGRCGSLLLHRVGLAPTTPCRSLRRTAKDSLRHLSMTIIPRPAAWRAEGPGDCKPLSAHPSRPDAPRPERRGSTIEGADARSLKGQPRRSPRPSRSHVQSYFNTTSQSEGTGLIRERRHSRQLWTIRPFMLIC
jgi:hypothetical protein